MSINNLRQCRMRQGVSLRSMARQMRCPVAEVKTQENPENSQLTLEQLEQWARLLHTPVRELVDESSINGVGLSSEVFSRVQALRVYKGLLSLEIFLENKQLSSIGNMLKVIKGDVEKIMPELQKHVTSWPSVGQRRTPDEMSAVEEKRIPSYFYDSENVEMPQLF